MNNSSNPDSARKLPEFKIALNYIKLAFRSVLLMAALVEYFFPLYPHADNISFSVR